jgi:mRNA interferase MazF
VTYVPDQGDFVWLNFDPQAGHEQAGHRPGIVLTPLGYNQLPGSLAIVCPITSSVKGYPWEVAIPAGQPVAGVVLSDHARSVDWKARRVQFKGKAPQAVLDEVLDKLGALLTIPVVAAQP